MNKKTSLITFLILALLASAIVPQKASAAGPTAIYIVHGINGVDMGQTAMEYDVDVWISGVGCVRSRLQFLGVIGPFNLASGNYTIAFSPANLALPCSNAPLVSGVFFFDNLRFYTVIMHLNTLGAPVISSYVHDVYHTTNNNGKARITVVHAANAGPVDVYLKPNAKPTVRIAHYLSNGNSSMIKAFAKKMKLWMTWPDSTAVIYGPMYLQTAKFYHYFIYLVGSTTNGLYTTSFSVYTRYNPYP
jgi:hypothetical protein